MSRAAASGAEGPAPRQDVEDFFDTLEAGAERPILGRAVNQLYLSRIVAKALAKDARFAIAVGEIGPVWIVGGRQTPGCYALSAPAQVIPDRFRPHQSHWEARARFVGRDGKLGKHVKLAGCLFHEAKPDEESCADFVWRQVEAMARKHLGSAPLALAPHRWSLLPRSL